MRIAGIVVFVFGFLICLSIVGIPFGIFLMIVGVLMMIFGGRSKTIITNVVQVSNAPGQSYAPPPEAAPYVPEVKQVSAREPPALAPPIDITPRREPLYQPRVTVAQSEPDYDRKKWQALLKYDPDLAKVANKMQELGDEWVDELARSYLAINDKTYLPNIVAQIIADARAQRTR